MRICFPASADCMVLKALWLIVVLVKQPSLGAGEVGVIVYVRARARQRLRARERERERTCCGDVWLVV